MNGLNAIFPSWLLKCRAAIALTLLLLGAAGCGGNDGGANGSASNNNAAVVAEQSALYGESEVLGVFDVNVNALGMNFAPVGNYGAVVSLTGGITITNNAATDMKGVVLRIGSLDPAITLLDADGYNFYNYGDIAAGSGISRNVTFSAASGFTFRAYVTRSKHPADSGVLEYGVSSGGGSISAGLVNNGRFFSDSKPVFGQAYGKAVATSGVASLSGATASLRLDASSNPKASYFQVVDKDLKYAYWDGSAWQTVVVDGSGFTGYYNSLALTSLGNPRISYYYGAASSNAVTEDLMYAFCNAGCNASGNWIKVAVDTAGDVGGYTSIALDGSGNPRISYYDFTNGDLKYAWCDSACETAANWTYIAIDNAGDVGRYTSLALDPTTGAPRISYYDYTNQTLKYAYCDASCSNPANWTLVTIDGTADRGRFTSLVLTAAGLPRISYYDYSTRTEGNGVPAYTYCDASCNNPASWTKVYLSGTKQANKGAYSSLMLDVAGNPAITYYYFNNGTEYTATIGDLEYAYCNTTCSNVANWRRATVDIKNDTGFFTSAALTAGNYLYVTYYDATTGDLKISGLQHPVIPNGWVEYATGVFNYNGHGNSIKTDLNDYPHISYTKNDTSTNYTSKANNLIRYAYYDGAAWQTVTLESGPVNNGAFWEPQTSLALNAAGKPRLLYVWDRNYLKYAYCDAACNVAGNWTKVTLVNVAGGSYQSFIGPSIALDSSGNPRISYWEQNTTTVANSTMKYGWCDAACNNAASWTLSAVDTVGNYSVFQAPNAAYPNDYYLNGGLTSLKLNATNQPRIAYYDATNGDLRYASYGSSASAVNLGAQSLLNTEGAAYSNIYASGPEIIAIPGNYRMYYSYYTNSGTALWQLAYKDTNNGSPPAASGTNLTARTLLNVGTTTEYASDPEVIQYVNASSQTRYRIYYRAVLSAFFCGRLAYRETTDANPPNAANLGAQVYLSIGNLSSCFSGGAATAPKVFRLASGQYRLFYTSYGGGGISCRRWLEFRDTTDTYPPDAGNLGAAQLLNTGTSATDVASGTEIVQLADGNYRMYYAWDNQSGCTRYWRLAYKDTNDFQPPAANGTNLGTQQLLNTGGTTNDRVTDPDIIAVTGGYRLYYSHFPQEFDPGGYRLAFKSATDANPPGLYPSFGWTTITVAGSGEDAGRMVSLALDSSGNPRVSYARDLGYVGINDTLAYAYCDANCTTASNWTTNVNMRTYVNSSSPLNVFNSTIVTAPSGFSQVSWMSQGYYSLYLNKCASNCNSTANWSSDTISSGAQYALWNSLALDAAENSYTASHIILRGSDNNSGLYFQRVPKY
ncbi:MAG: hypothetical protein HY886_11070 [Deltaproteobacteria bacterium]|nr:hypothetical protein [Deltaproteobacteria bacterium]